MTLTADFDGGFKFEEIWLTDEHLARFVTQMLDVFFTQLNVLAWFFPTNLQQLSDHSIDLLVVHLHIFNYLLLNS